MTTPAKPESAVAGSERYFDHDHITIIEPPSGLSILDIGELWAYRELLWVLTLRDIKIRYKQTVLGASWAIIRPVTTMVIFSIIFGGLANIPSDGYPYPIFVFAGLLPWTFFSGAVGACSASLVSSGHLVSKVYFPRLIIPISSIGAGLVDFGIATIVLLVLMIFFGISMSMNILAAPFLIVALVISALGIGIGLSALTVAYRDFSHVVPFLIQVWLYITPVIYPVTIVPESWRWILFLNPMTGIVDAFRSTFLGQPFSYIPILVSVTISGAMFAMGIAYFEKVERRFADII